MVRQPWFAGTCKWTDIYDRFFLNLSCHENFVHFMHPIGDVLMYHKYFSFGWDLEESFRESVPA